MGRTERLGGHREISFCIMKTKETTHYMTKFILPSRRRMIPFIILSKFAVSERKITSIYYNNRWIYTRKKRSVKLRKRRLCIHR